MSGAGRLGSVLERVIARATQIAVTDAVQRPVRGLRQSATLKLGATMTYVKFALAMAFIGIVTYASVTAFIIHQIQASPIQIAGG
jgi:hypothetical protein